MATTLPTPLGPPSAPVPVDAQNIPGDWLIDADGQCVISGGDAVLATGVQSIAQEARIALLLVLGEWFLDEEAGVPWYDLIFIKDPNFVAIRAILMSTLLDVAGIKDVTSMNLTFSAATRVLRVDWVASTDFGELIQTTEKA